MELPTPLKKMTAKGQSTIEAALALPLVVVLIMTLTTICYRASVYFWAEHQLHEAILCLDSSSERACENDFSPRIKKLLLFKEDLTISLRKSHNYSTGELQIKLKPLIHIKQRRYEKK